MVFDDRRKSSTPHKLLYASLALNLFVGGVIAGNFFAGSGNILPFGNNGANSAREFRGPEGPPAPTEMLNHLRERLSPEGRVIFDAEMQGLIAELGPKRAVGERFRIMGQVLLSDDPTEQDIRAAFTDVERNINDEIKRVIQQLANVAVKLSPEDRYQLAINTPPPPMSKYRP
ncbi:MAG: periplasmic heavy metal sensor [Pseudomonadota bacterium]